MSRLDEYALPAFVTFASLGQQARFARRVGLARLKYNVPVPITHGDDLDPAFVRTHRAHQNSVEFFPIAVSSLWVSSVFFHPVPASVAGIIYMIGRQSYFNGYVEKEDKRLPGFFLSIRALLALLFMAGLGSTTSLLRRYTGRDLAAMASDLIGKIANRR